MDSVAKATPLGDDILSLIGGVLKTHSGAARCPEQLAIDANGATLRTPWPESFLNKEQGQGPPGTATLLSSPGLPSSIWATDHRLHKAACLRVKSRCLDSYTTLSESCNIRNGCSGCEGWKEARNCEGVTCGLLR